MVDTIFFTINIDTLNELQKRHPYKNQYSCESNEDLLKHLQNNQNTIVIVDYDSVAQEFNKLISANLVPNKTIVLEKRPAIATGKMLISHNIQAYGNLRMLLIHYKQMMQTVIENKIWTYPELTNALIKDNSKPNLHEDSIKLIDDRLSTKEKDIVFLILNGLTNDAIASKLNITTRTVKAHISSIFSKLHINDRLSLVLLLR